MTNGGRWCGGYGWQAGVLGQFADVRGGRPGPLREHTGLSREEFGDRVGLSKHTVASVELGRRMPDPTFAERSEAVLGNTGAMSLLQRMRGDL